MKGLGYLIAALCAAWLAGAAASAVKPVDLFAQLPALRSIRLSPDGTKAVAIRAHKGRPAVVIYDLVTPGASPIVLPSDDVWVIEDVVWASHDRFVILGGSGQKVWWAGRQMFTIRRAISMTSDGENGVVLLGTHRAGGFNFSMTDLVDLTIQEPDYVYMPLYVESSNRFGFRNDLHQVDLKTGKGALLKRGGPDTVRWYTDGYGQILARLDEMERPLRQRLLAYENDEWRELVTVETGGDIGIGIVGPSSDGGSLVHSWRFQGRRGLAAYNLKTAAHKSVFVHPRYDVSGPVLDEWTGRVIGASFDADKEEYVYFDAAHQKKQRALERAFPGLSVTTVSRPLTGSTTIVLTEGPKQPPTYYLLDTATNRADFLAESYPGLEEADLGEMKPYPYKARDGLDIPAYLTLPPGGAAKNLPLVVMPHGGPDARDRIGFDWWAQFLANRGYAVLQPNFRGSAGYGRAFTEAGLQQWGLKMQDDISDGVMKAIADGIADPKRVCIVGASYGGYAALAGATLTPDLYACAVSVAGISDLPKMIAGERKRHGRHSSTVSFWISRIGSPSDDSDRLRATSPARLAANVKAPILLLHGENDTTVPIEQSELMAEALEDENKPVSFVRFEGDDHYLQIGATRLKMLTEIERFLAQHIGG